MFNFQWTNFQFVFGYFLSEEIKRKDGEGADDSRRKADGKFIKPKNDKRGDGEVNNAGRTIVAKRVVIEGKVISSVVKPGFKNGVCIPANANFVGMKADGMNAKFINSEKKCEKKNGDEAFIFEKKFH